jgi:hypothetical protein
MLFSAGPGAALLTAPHACVHRRDGAWKMAEPRSGMLATALSERSGARALVLAADAAEDGNYDERSSFRDAVWTLLSGREDSYLLDLHEMRDGHGAEIILGTAEGRAPQSLVEMVAAVGQSIGATVATRGTGPLSAGNPGRTLTNWALRHGIPALQIEMSVSVGDRLFGRPSSPSSDEGLLERLTGWCGWRSGGWSLTAASPRDYNEPHQSGQAVS